MRSFEEVKEPSGAKSSEITTENRKKQEEQKTHTGVLPVGVWVCECLQVEIIKH